MLDWQPVFRMELRRWRWRRVLGQWLGLYLCSLLLAAGLARLWAGDSFYNGVGPRATERWFFSFAVSQAPALAVWAALTGMGAWRRLAHSGVLAHALASPLRPMGLLAGVAASAVGPVAMWVAASSVAWGLLVLAVGGVTLGAVLFAHALLLAQALAFGLIGPALVAAPGGRPARTAAAVAAAGGGILLALAAMFAVGPLLGRSGHPERWITAALVVNPAVAMGTALNLDVLRTPWIYQWTPIPEYRFAYPAPVWTLLLYTVLAGCALCTASRRLQYAE